MKILVINPEKFDYLASSIIEGLLLYNVELYFTSSGNGALQNVSDEDLLNKAIECDYIFAIWGKKAYNFVEPYKSKFNIINETNTWNKTIYIDGSEYNYTGSPGNSDLLLHPDFFSKVLLYCKRECLPEHIDLGIVPLLFAADSKYFTNLNVEKSIDVLCAFGQTFTGMRKVAIEACNELKHEGYNIITDTVTDYLTKVSQSHIVVDAFGGGECNARLFQVTANKACLFAQKHNIVLPNFKNDEDYISWDTKEELKDKIRYYLANKEILAKVTQNGYNSTINYQTPTKRIEYIFNQLQKKQFKIGFAVTAHYSDEFRPDGKMYVHRFCDSVKKHCKYNYNIYVVDNGSSKNIDITQDSVTKVITIEDQFINGITGGFNEGIYNAYLDGCDIIINCSDDQWFNDTVNKLIQYIIDTQHDDALYSGLTKGVLSGSQLSDGPKSGIQIKKGHDPLNGYCVAMTRAHYKQYCFEENKYFNQNNKYNGGDGKWAGQEGQFIENYEEKGVYGIVVNECYIDHDKIRAWKKVRDIDRNNN